MLFLPTSLSRELYFCSRVKEAGELQLPQRTLPGFLLGWFLPCPTSRGQRVSMEQHHPGGLWLCQGAAALRGFPLRVPSFPGVPRTAPLAGRLGMSRAFCVFVGGTLKGRDLKITSGTASGHELASSTITQEGKEEKITLRF